MEKYNISIRQATKNDATIIAKVVAMAIGDNAALQNYCGKNYNAVLTEIAAANATQYSWQNTIIAEHNGNVAGAAVGYDGAMLEALRYRTLVIVQKHTGHVPTIVNETETGEYYLDSIAVMPEFRGTGVGKHLVNAFCDKAFEKGHERVGLIVDIENPNAEKLYISQGFRCVGERTFFGHQMKHMQRMNHWNIRERVMRSVLITEFQRKVYLELLNVPSGTTITYSELAQRIGCRSAQAVGQALKRNPFAPDVPCHRVIATNGSLGGYNGEKTGEMLDLKKKFLEEEMKTQTNRRL